MRQSFVARVRWEEQHRSVNRSRVTEVEDQLAESSAEPNSVDTAQENRINGQ